MTTRTPTIAFIGGGSCKFVQGAVADLLQYEELQGSRITLMDVDPQRLARAEQLTRLMIRERGAAMTVQATTDQRTAVAGADYVFLTVMVGGMRHYQSDTKISARHGVFEAVGDTTGPGAVFRLVRTAPVLRELVRNLRETAPAAWILSYVNPMAMVTRALHELGHPKTLGLCHSVASGVKEIAKWLALPADEIEYTAAGINHLCFYLTLRHGGRDLYPDLRANAARIIREAAVWEADTWQQERRGYERVRMELLEHLGYLPAEGPWHQGEYYPWFRKTAALLETYGPPTGWAYAFDKKLGVAWEENLQQIIAGTKPLAVDHA